MRILLLSLLVALGFVAASEPRLGARGRQLAESVWQQHGAEGFQERAPPARTPVRVTVRSGDASPPPRLADGGCGLLGERLYSASMPRHVAVRPSADAPGIGERDRRRQPEGRGPPRRPTTA